MDISRTISILEALASGCSPKTGEMLQHESVLNEREVIRALQIAIDNLKAGSDKEAKQKTVKRDPWDGIDYFQKEKFNKLSDENVKRLKEKVKELGVVKTENVAEYILAAREKYPRAYEPWEAKEKELLSYALKFTNDLDLLSECFQRGRGSIESCGKRILYESQAPV